MRSLSRVAVFAAIFACGAIAFAQETPVAPPSPSDAANVDMARVCRGDPQRYYPIRALSRRVSGRVVLDCAVGADGKMTSCQVVEEAPQSYEFGRAALVIACNYRAPDANELRAPGSEAQIYSPDPNQPSQRRMRFPIEFNVR